MHTDPENSSGGLGDQWWYSPAVAGTFAGTGMAVRTGKINKAGNNKCWRGCGEKGTLLDCWWECELVQPLWKTVWMFLKELKIDLPYDPATVLLGIYPKDSDAMKHQDTCTPMFIAAMSTIAKKWKEPQCPSKDKWIKM